MTHFPITGNFLRNIFQVCVKLWIKRDLRGKLCTHPIHFYLSALLKIYFYFYLFITLNQGGKKIVSCFIPVINFFPKSFHNIFGNTIIIMGKFVIYIVHWLYLSNS